MSKKKKHKTKEDSIITLEQVMDCHNNIIGTDEIFYERFFNVLMEGGYQYACTDVTNQCITYSREIVDLSGYSNAIIRRVQIVRVLENCRAIVLISDVCEDDEDTNDAMSFSDINLLYVTDVSILNDINNRIILNNSSLTTKSDNLERMMREDEIQNYKVITEYDYSEDDIDISKLNNAIDNQIDDAIKQVIKIYLKRLPYWKIFFRTLVVGLLIYLIYHFR